MKRFILMMAIAIFAASTAIAQQGQHATFMGIEMGGDIYDFHKQLTKKGFKKTETFQDAWIYTGGKFSGNYVDLMVAYTSQNLVQSVGVLYETGDEYYNLLRTYNSLKEQLTTKYGKPTVEIEQNPKNKYLSLSEIASGERMYNCSFKIPNGSVLLMITADSAYSGSVFLSYSDDKTQASFDKEQFNDL